MFLNALSGENKNQPKSTSSMETIIGSGTEINGDINFSGSGVLRIDGKVTGKITAEQSKIIVGEEAFIDAEIVTQNIVINGEVQGNIKVTQTMELLPTARLIGDVRVKGLKISEGAIFKGTCDMLGLSSTPEPKPSYEPKQSAFSSYQKPEAKPSLASDTKEEKEEKKY